MRLLTGAAMLSGTLASLQTPSPPAPAAAHSVTATRIAANPLITVDSSPSLGSNVNGPTVIRVPDWVRQPLGRYYMYFANHMGTHVRLAYADAVTGPWKVYEPGVLQVSETAFFRPQPDPEATLDNFYTHVASPEIWIDAPGQRLVLWVHGWWTNGERWPADPAEAAAWSRAKSYGQYTQAAVSTDGLHFEVRPPITRLSYLRVFPHAGAFYGVARLGQLARAGDPLAAFEIGPNPFRDTPYARRVRHVGLLKHAGHLDVFFTAIGDAPERVLLSTVELAGDWQEWQATTPVAVLEPGAAYECADLAVTPSLPGDIATRVRQLRDPFVFEDEGHAYLFYSTCGEQGIAAARLEFH